MFKFSATLHVYRARQHWSMDRYIGPGMARQTDTTDTTQKVSSIQGGLVVKGLETSTKYPRIIRYGHWTGKDRTSHYLTH